MNPNTTHVDYDSTAPEWSRARAVLAGEDAVKAAGELFLPRLDMQTDDDYEQYKTRASFYNATSRTAAGYVGMIFRRAPFIKLHESDKAREVENDFDLRGTSLIGYAKSVVAEVVQLGRAGTLIDWTDTEARPYASIFKAEAILNWRSERINGRYTLTLVTLAEPAIIPTDDPFVTATENRIRVLRLIPSSTSSHGERNDDNAVLCGDVAGKSWAPPATEAPPSSLLNSCVPNSFHYEVQIWREVRTNKTTEWQLVESYVPKRLGKPLTFIPFVFHGPVHSRPEVQRPPLNDIIALNLDHYRLDADYKHGIHYTALPTPWAGGFDPDNYLKIGSSTAWISANPAARAGFLEFTGQGLETFERAMERDERLMAILGTRLLETQKREAETAEALQIRHAGEESILSTLALSVSDSLTRALRIVTWWIPTTGASLDASPDALDDAISLNTDFGIKGLTAQELQSIVAAWQAKAFSTDTMLELFRKGEILPDGRSNSEELSLLHSAAPTGQDENSPGQAQRRPGNKGQTVTSLLPSLPSVEKSVS